MLRGAVWSLNGGGMDEDVIDPARLARGLLAYSVTNVSIFDFARSPSTQLLYAASR